MSLNFFVAPRCDCGKVAVSRCCDGMVLEGQVPCGKPVCREDGAWCETHRHRAGSVGFGTGTCKVTSFQGFRGTGPIWDKVRGWWWSMRSMQWQANKLLRNHILNCPPPAPIPPFEIRFVDGSLWRSDDELTRMIQVHQ